MASATTTRDPQKWRGKYLRALNICPPNVEKPMTSTKTKVRSRVACENDLQSFNRRYSSTSSSMDREEDGFSPFFYPSPRAFTTTAHSHGCHPSLQPPPVLYPFVIKPLLARNRRCHTDPFELEERLSAPIQIPRIHVNNQVDGNLRDESSGTRTQICVEHSPDEEEEPDIFEMEWEDQVRKPTQSSNRKIILMDEEPESTIVVSPEEECTRSKPLCHSFIPPHELKQIQQDCFSIGLRHEFKRLPTNPI